jgi:ribosome modulation factor
MGGVQFSMPTQPEEFTFGVDANRAGVPANANPYTYSDDRVHWLKGWMHGEKAKGKQ